MAQTMKKLVCHKLTTNFVEGTKVITSEVPKPGAGQVLVRNRFVGINATDVNITAGRMYGAPVTPPFDIGLEGVAEVVSLGSNVNNVKVGQAVTYLDAGAYAEYKVIDANKLMPIPSAKAEYMPLVLSGLTATLAMDKVGEVKPGDTVLVTAAAGGTGQFAVQWAKLKGASKVLGTCSTDDKIDFLKKIGCDRPINYKTENLDEVLKKECPNGVSLVYECIGGEVFDTCVANLAQHGRLVIIGSITGYKTGEVTSKILNALPTQLLRKSASARGFLLFHYAHEYGKYLTEMVQLYDAGKLKSSVDMGESTGKKFSSVDDVGRAVDYLYSGKSVGKIVVEFGK